MAPRLRKAETPADVWLAHRKLRKKIASAKWYAKKKKREIREQNQRRKELEAEYQAKQAALPWIWTSPLQRAYWRCVVEHHVRGYPPRPTDMDPHTWLRDWVDVVEDRIRTTRQELQDVEWARYVPWDDHMGFTKVLRQLGIRSLRTTGMDWVTGIEGVWLAGCIRFAGGDTVRGWDMARAVFHTRTVHPTQIQITNHIRRSRPPSTPPSNTPHQKDPQDTDIQRWIAHTFLFPPPTTMFSWYDSDDEEEWLRNWEAANKEDTGLSPPQLKKKDFTEEDSQNSLPSSLDHFVDEVFHITQPPTPDYDADQHQGSGTEDSDSDEDSSSQPSQQPLS